MTIKQQGGIFGRNPTFNDLNAIDITTTNLDATDIDVTNIDTGTLHVATNIELTPASSTFGTAPAITHYTNGYVYMTGGTGGLILRDNGGSVGIQIQNDDYIKFETGNPAAEAARFNSSGNLAFPSGQGIDFSATSGTGTSELFDDYEEGTWTPVVVGSSSAGTGTYTTQSATYTKVGRAVTFEFSLVWTGHTGTGFIKIGGFPFNPAAQTYYVVQTENIALTANNIAVTARVDAAGDKGFLIQSPTGGGARAIVAMDTAGDIQGSGTYQV